MIVKVISDVNTESVLRAVSGYSFLSIVEFYEGSFFKNVTASNYNGLKLRKTIDSLVNGGFLEALPGSVTPSWKITQKGLDHLAFLERVDVKEIVSVTHVNQPVASDTKSEFGSMIRRDVRFIVDSIYALISPAVDRRQKAQ